MERSLKVSVKRQECRQATSSIGTIRGTGITRVRATLLMGTLETSSFAKRFRRRCREAVPLFTCILAVEDVG